MASYGAPTNGKKQAFVMRRLRRADEFLEKHLPLRWTTVRGFGKVKYFNISYVVLLTVPIIVELHAKAAGASERFRELVALPPTLLWLYGASLAYAIGIALYQYFCPEDIKRFGNRDEFVRNSYEMFLRAHPHHRLSIVSSHLDPTIDAEVLNEIETRRDKIDSSAGEEQRAAQAELDTYLASLHADAVQRYLIKKYNLENRQRTAALRLSFLLYLVGTGILLVLLIMRSVHVLIPH
jgi:hypothetical protein